MLDEIKAFLGSDWTDTLGLIRSSLASDIGLLNTTNEAILAGSGKKLRPLVSLLAARACSSGVSTRDSIRFAVASELLHNATLLHDDVVDCSSERRGKPTVGSILGGPASVLIGDFWLVKAVDNILSSTSHGEEVIRIFSKTLSDLAEGEILQLQKAASGDTGEEDYLRIIYCKTASLFEASCISGAISVDASPSMIEAVREYSVCLGMAFQIRDDMLDYSGGDGLGKPVGLDLEEGKITLPLLGALAAADPEEAALVRRKVADLPSRPEYKEEVRSFVFSHGGDGYAARRLDEYVVKAVSALETLPESREKDYLAEIAAYTAGRER